MPRPYVLLSCAMSIDGYIDDTTPERLLLSNAEDFDRVDAVRATCDAILIGANTIRKDNPRLIVNSPERRAQREARGLPAHPLKVTVTASGNLSPDLKIWHHGGDKVVYCTDSALAKLTGQLGDLADIVALGPAVDLAAMLDDLGQRGIGRLMVEGGSEIHTQFLTQDLANELQLAIAPFFVGDPTAPRFIRPGTFPHGPTNRMTLEAVEAVGDVCLARYQLHFGHV